MDSKRILNVWRKVLSNWRYSLSIIVIALVFYSVNIFISNWGSIINLYPSLGFFGTIKFFAILAIGFKKTVLLSSFVSLIIISLLFGLLFSLIIYKTNMAKVASGKTFGFFGSVGIFLGILAPGCAACGIGLLSFFGVSAAVIGSLPFGGLELSILSIGIISFSIIKITDKVDGGEFCSIELKGG